MHQPLLMNLPQPGSHLFATQHSVMTSTQRHQRHHSHSVMSASTQHQCDRSPSAQSPREPSSVVLLCTRPFGLVSLSGAARCKPTVMTLQGWHDTIQVQLLGCHDTIREQPWHYSSAAPWPYGHDTTSMVFKHASVTLTAVMAPFNRGRGTV